MVKRSVDLLILGSEQTVVVPVVPEASDSLGVVEDGGVAIDHGRIIQVAASDLLERKYSGRKVIDASGRIILPGFVDPHSHLVFSGSREREFQGRILGEQYLDRLRSGGGIMDTVRSTRQASEQELYAAARQRLELALINGTTTIEVKTGYGLNAATEMKLLRVIRRLQRGHMCNVIGTFLGAHAIPPEQPSSDGYSKYVIDVLLPLAHKVGGADFCDVFCESGVFNPSQSSKILREAGRLGFRLKIHADEFADSGGARVANDLHAVSADHLVHTGTEDLQKMVESKVVPVLLPGSSESLLMRDHAPAREMFAMGLPVAIGTDFSPANWMLSQLASSVSSARVLRMTSSEIIRGITTNAARALGREGRVGSLSPGYSADLVFLKAPDYRWVGYAHGEGLVDKVLIGGKTIVEGGRISGRGLV